LSLGLSTTNSDNLLKRPACKKGVKLVKPKARRRSERLAHKIHFSLVVVEHFSFEVVDLWKLHRCGYCDERVEVVHDHRCHSVPRTAKFVPMVMCVEVWGCECECECVWVHVGACAWGGGGVNRKPSVNIACATIKIQQQMDVRGTRDEWARVARSCWWKALHLRCSSKWAGRNEQCSQPHRCLQAVVDPHDRTDT
jgi:hypothetical protein